MLRQTCEKKDKRYGRIDGRNWQNILLLVLLVFQSFRGFSGKAEQCGTALHSEAVAYLSPEAFKAVLDKEMATVTLHRGDWTRNFIRSLCQSFCGSASSSLQA